MASFSLPYLRQRGHARVDKHHEAVHEKLRHRIVLLRERERRERGREDERGGGRAIQLATDDCFRRWRMPLKRTFARLEAVCLATLVKSSEKTNPRAWRGEGGKGHWPLRITMEDGRERGGRILM
jgi:hypothetical protein